MIKIGSNSADAIYFGLSAVDKLYYNGEMIWPDSGMTYFVLADGSVIRRYVKGQLLSTAVPDSVVSAVVGERVTSIGASSFASQSALSSVTVPDSVADVQSNAFSGCTSLVSADLPGVKTLGANAFNNCSSLTAVEFSDELSAIGDGAFKFAKALTSIYIPSSVSSLNGSVFYGCTNLESMALPSDITSIGGTCFKECRSLKTLNLPEQL